MDRRNLLKASLGLSAAVGLLTRAGLTLAHDHGTPEATPADGGIPVNTWRLVSIDNAGTLVEPKETEFYTVQFTPDGNIGIQADCNVGGAGYTVTGQSLTVEQGISTLVACENMELSNLFWASLNAATSWAITTDASDQLEIAFGADGTKMLFAPALTGVTWQWVNFASSDGTTTTVDAPERYTLAIAADSSLQVQADCNSGKGNATITGSEIDLMVATTRKLCDENSMDNQFLVILDQSNTFVVRSGHLFLALPMDAGIAEFQPVLPSSNATPAT